MIGELIAILFLICFIGIVLFVLKMTGCFDNKNDLRK